MIKISDIIGTSSPPPSRDLPHGSQCQPPACPIAQSCSSSAGTQSQQTLSKSASSCTPTTLPWPPLGKAGYQDLPAGTFWCSAQETMEGTRSAQRGCLGRMQILSFYPKLSISVRTELRCRELQDPEQFPMLTRSSLLQQNAILKHCTQYFSLAIFIRNFLVISPPGKPEYFRGQFLFNGYTESQTGAQWDCAPTFTF